MAFARCCSIASRMVSILPSLAFRLQVENVGRRRRRRRAQQVLENPLAALHHRGPVGVRRHRQDAALPQQPAAVGIGQRHPAELRAVDIRDAVVLGQALIEEGVVGVQQFQHAAVFAQDALEEQLGLLPERLAQALVEFGEDVGIGLLLRPGCGGRATGRRNSRPALRTRGSSSMRRTCCVQHRGILQLAFFRQVQQLVVGNAAPQEEGKPRGQFEIADAVNGGGGGVRAGRARCGTGSRGRPAWPAAPFRCRSRNRPRRGRSGRRPAAA